MNQSDGRDWLDAVLRRVEGDIPDAGFCDRVMQALPPKPDGERFRFVVVTTFAAVASLVCFFLLPAGDFVWESVCQVFSPDAWITASVSIGSLVIVAMIIWGSYSLATAGD